MWTRNTSENGGAWPPNFDVCHGHGYGSCKITCTTTPLARPCRPCMGSGRTRHRPRPAPLRDEHHLAESVPLLDLGVGVDHFL